MINFNKTLRRLPNYVRRFGFLRGLTMALQIERYLPRMTQDMRQFTVPGFLWPIYLRDSMGDHATFWQCIVSEQYALQRFPQARRLMESYQASLLRGEQPLIIDCGANIGLAALWFANAFPQAHIVAVEPDRDNFALLKKNIEPYGNRVQAIHGGIWNTEGHLRIENPSAGSAAFRVVPCGSEHSDAVRTVTIPSICAQIGDRPPLIVKIDIEGAQGPMFTDTIDWIGDTSLIVLELDDWQLPWAGTSRPFFSAVSQWPFDYLLGGESIFCFRDFHASIRGG